MTDSPTSLDGLPMAMTGEHAFAPYLRILGKGKRGSRSLTREEARHAFSMILSSAALDVQVGAFLMLLRVKEESVEELTGFVEAVRQHVTVPNLAVDLDWSSYAGKRKHFPWFVLSALLLAQSGVRIVMHGTAGNTANRLYTETALQALGYPLCQSVNQIEAELDRCQFAYVPLSVLSPRLQSLIDLRQALGLRSPVHTLTRLINPFNATTSIQAIFHPAYRTAHQQTAFALGYQNTLVIKGEGGEFERNPDADTVLAGIRDGMPYEERWERRHDARSEAEEDLNLERFVAVWRGELTHPYAEQAVIGTTALVLFALKKANSETEAYQQAQELWVGRFNREQHYE